MSFNRPSLPVAVLFGGICLGAVVAIGAIRSARQVEPPLSPWYIADSQYYPPGTEFKLSREAAAMKAYKADIEAQQAGQ